MIAPLVQPGLQISGITLPFRSRAVSVSECFPSVNSDSTPDIRQTMIEMEYSYIVVQCYQ